MNDSFDDELRQSLHNRADELPRRPDLSRGAIAQARSIRRRRRVAGTVAAVALVAISVPVGLRVTDVMSGGEDPIAPAIPAPSGPVNVKLDLTKLPEGGPPSVPYLDGTTVVDGDDEIDVSGPAMAIAPTTDGVYVTSTNWQLTHYTTDGETEDLGRIQSTPVASADGEWAAWATNANGSATLVLRDANGEESTVELDGAEAYSVDVHTIVDGTAYFTYYLRGNGRNVPLQTWSSGDEAPEPVDGDIDATAVSRDGNLAAPLELVHDFRNCATIVDLATGDETGKQCGPFFSIKGFSPDGRYAWADNAEGYGPTQVTILDTETGEVIRRYDSASQRNLITFADTTFEDDDSLLIRAEQDGIGQTALVRCDVITGDCELAAPLADGTGQTGGALPYLLPDVG